MVIGMRALPRKVVRDLWHLRSQMAATAIVMACGVAMFVTLRSMHDWLIDTQDAYYEQFRFADVFAGLRQAPLSVADTLARIPGVAVVEPRVVRDVSVELPGLAEPGTVRLVGIPAPERPMLNGVYLRDGRWPDPFRGSEVLVSVSLAQANGFRPGDSLAAVINGRWQRLHITGTGLSPEYVYEIRGLGDIFPDNRRFGIVWMSTEALASAFEMSGGFNDVSFKLAPGAIEADVITAVDQVLAPWGGTGAYGRPDQVSHLFLESEIEETQVTSILLPGIFLGVTAFLLHLVLARLVAMQREQVAVLKAFGYRNRSIAFHYVQLAAGPVLVGAVVGTAVGVLLAGEMAGIYARFFQFPSYRYAQDWSVVLLAFLVCGGAALLGALNAVRRAVRLPPAEAMRPESPVAYRPGLLERSRLVARLTPGQRMGLRHLTRRPVKAALSVLGLALATAIVMTGWFMWDTINVMKVIQFEQVQRYDALVLFEGPRDGAALHELARIDGVRLVEPFRVAPARLTHGPASRRVAVQGLQPGGTLLRLVERTGAVREVPEGGLQISEVLANQFRVRAGDTVSVEILEGRRAVTRTVVASVSEDLLGLGTTMSLPALGAMLGEPTTVSGAYLSVEPALAGQVYAALRERPAVAGVVVRESVIRGFDQTIAESFLISITLMVGFAVTIAAGIVYNSARVALSEQGRELASLRVLGFSRADVTRLLLGEQAVLTVLGIPAGLALGYGIAWLITSVHSSELFRLPLVVRERTFVLSVLAIAVTAALTGLAIRRRTWRLDLVAVLKTRE